MSEEQLAALLKRKPVKEPAKRGNKFNAVRVGASDSKKEERYRQTLEIRERAGEVRNVQAHPKYALAIAGELITTYTADFQYEEKLWSGNWIKRVVDCKGMKKGTAWQLFQLKRRLMLLLLGIDVLIA